MKTKPWKLLLPLLLVVLGNVSLADERVLVQAVVEKDAPWVHKDGKSSAGIEVDIMRAIAEIMGYRLQVRHFPLKRMSLPVVSGKADILLLAYPVSAIKTYNIKGLYVDTTPLVQIRVGAFALKRRAIKVNGIKALHGYEVGHLTAMDDIENLVLPGLENRMRVITQKQLVKTLYGGRIDVAVSGVPGFMHYAEALNIGNAVEPLIDLPAFGLYPAWSVKASTGESWVAAFPQAVKALKSQGVLEGIINRYSNTDYFVMDEVSVSQRQAPE
ncbi:amino acid ABC transporter substrate-binding protein [Pseudomaricurvus alkylphenolicus]|jgi:ABC-type amino acid transport substrate-binding protein|uniref:transporter substrate-binding domain-containing protein n=1 Tax=Pseudomaricurvus alkylphenolicus TaxID=1306991 RepID=UPI00141FE03F|nr:transporter substrate-binding domain-containing protein [Pseudomaricurvus alkylphenolicus]NIB38555.1 amino acid ABC transporter substrate-binding protein [Pseudomaricurvus alkylphenolicus]